MRCVSRLLTAAAVVLAAAGSASAAPVFGPQTFEVVGDTDSLYAETITVDAAGPYALFVRNGDDDGSRVDSVVVSVNGSDVLDADDLLATVSGTRSAVELDAGDNELTIALTGAAGSFVTLAVVPPDELPVFAAGRLLLPWGRDDDALALALALRNGSARFPRIVRVVFFDPDGGVAAATGRFPIAPHASAAATAESLLDGAPWNTGSVAVFWAGRGTARVFGTARQTGPGLWDAEPLQQAGYHLFRAAVDPDPASRRSRFAAR